MSTKKWQIPQSTRHFFVLTKSEQPAQQKSANTKYVKEKRLLTRRKVPNVA